MNVLVAPSNFTPYKITRHQNLSNRICIVLSLILLNICVNAQLASPSLVSNSGASFQSDEIIIDFAIGEIMTETFESANLILTQGFLQPDINTSIGIKLKASDFEYNIYPNPAINYFYISFNQSTFNDELNLLIYDIDGRIVVKDKIVMVAMKVDIANLNPGTYLIKIQDKNLNINSTAKLFKIE